MSEMFPSPISLDIQDLPAIPTPDRDELAPIETIVDIDEGLPYKRILLSHDRIMHIINPDNEHPIKILQFNSMTGLDLLLIQNKIVPLLDIQSLTYCEPSEDGAAITTDKGTKIIIKGLTPADVATLICGLSQWLQGMHA